MNFLSELGQCKISVWKGDICTLRIGAIVNAANSHMLGCFSPSHPCIDNAIHDKAGPRLRAACRDLMRAQGTLENTGCAKITPAFCLPSEFVLHTVGPIYPEHGEREDLLASCYTECLKLAQEKGIRTVAFCCISTGVFGYPILPATLLALRTVKNYLSTNQNFRNFDAIVFNVFKDEDLELYIAKCPKYFGEGRRSRARSF
eukprot:TRINITY_DN11778_c0_g2_i4.p1 TRINITY_DN11778_c0_g2~~TRINITY_DN11778_c0_g2_i4.p1  ORF type:complete len:202 (-),score=23.18 TRINITY_DN11778_c0_g2_i4:84-689(-)